MHFIYFLQSERDGRYYIGVSSRVNKRLKEHNQGLSKSTKPWRPWKLRRIEKYNNIKDIYKRERFLKAMKSKKIINKIVSDKSRPPTFCRGVGTQSVRAYSLHLPAA